jgi:hypothetical protein
MILTIAQAPVPTRGLMPVNCIGKVLKQVAIADAIAVALELTRPLAVKPDKARGVFGMIITLPLALPRPRVPVQVTLAITEELIQLKIPKPRALVDKIQL